MSYATDRYETNERTSLFRSMQTYTNGRAQKARSLLEEFREFIAQGSIIDLAVGLVLGKAFTDILNSFVVDILSPCIAIFADRSMADNYYVLRCPPTSMHCNHLTWPTPQEARDAGATTINYGLFGENVLNFLIKGLFLFLVIKKMFEVLFQRQVNVNKQCPYCKDRINGAATVCKSCGSDQPQ